MKFDMIIRNAHVYQSFTQDFRQMDVAILQGNFFQVAPCIDAQADEIVDATGLYMVPGLVDIHMHIESSMSIPSRFSSAVLPHGTTSVVADPHEIANVFGMEGILSFLSCETTLDIFYGIPSSVPSTNVTLETTGGIIGVEEVRTLLQHPRIKCLGEVMNFKDLCYEPQSLIRSIIETCKQLRPELPIEGHCPKITGRELASFIAHGVSADHTHQTPESLVEKIQNGMFIEVQRKSMNKELISAIMNHQFYEYISFVTDDVMADHLRDGHLNELVKLAVTLGMPVEKAIYCSTFTPARRMHLEDRGAICPGRLADFILLSDVTSFQIEAVYKKGVLVQKDKEEAQPVFPEHFATSLRCRKAVKEDFELHANSCQVLAHIMQIEPHATFTKHIQEVLPVHLGLVDTTGYALLTVMERYGKSGNIAHGLVSSSITQGAIATSWAHDHHNVMVLGIEPEDMVIAQHALLEMQGGFVVVKDRKVIARAVLEIGGIVSAREISVLGKELEEVREAMKSLGYVHDNEIMSISTLSLPVSPQLKLTDVGLLDTRTQNIVPLLEEVE